MDIFGIIMVSVGFGVYGTYICCCIFDIWGECYNNINCCKKNLPLDQNLEIGEQDFRLPLTLHLQDIQSENNNI